MPPGPGENHQGQGKSHQNQGKSHQIHQRQGGATRATRGRKSPRSPGQGQSRGLCQDLAFPKGAGLTLKMTRMFSPSGSTFWKESFSGTALELK